MFIADMNTFIRLNSSNQLRDTLTSDTHNYRVVYRLDDVLIAKGISIKELGRLTGLRPNTLSDFMRGKLSTVQLAHVLAIMSVLDIKDMNEIITIELD